MQRPRHTKAILCQPQPTGDTSAVKYLLFFPPHSLCEKFSAGDNYQNYTIFATHNQSNMRYKKQALSAIFLLAVGLTGLKAQEAITASGGNATGSGGSTSYSVGQVVYTTNTASGGTLSQGVQQPFEISIISGIEEQGINLSYTAYPNPTTTNVILKIDASIVETQNLASLQYTLSDINGKQINQQPISGNQTIIPMEQLPAGTYFVTIVQTLPATSHDITTNQLKTFKIIKQ